MKPLNETLCLLGVLAYLACGAIPVLAANEPAPAHLRCEYLQNPLGIETTSPRLSWILISDRRGQKQTAYQVLVASSEELLAKDRGDLWDSGKVASDQSIQVEYAGKPPMSRMRCYWKVRVWDKDGKASDWSQPAKWTMGLLKPEDWKAKWIGCEKGASDIPDATCPYFRKEFTTKGPVRRATIHATALGVMELWLNGKRIGDDFFMPGWTEYSKRLYYVSYDVTALVRSGGNCLGAILGDGWYGLHSGGRGRLRLKAQLEIEYADGAGEVLPTDSSWKATFRGPVLMSDFYQGESYDARREMRGWNEPGFDDKSWTQSFDNLNPEFGSVDATDTVRKAVKGGLLSIRAGNELFGDPAYGIVKALKVEYAIGGRKETQTVSEGAVLDIRAPAGEKIKILKATYGVIPNSSQIILQAYPGVPVRKVEEFRPVARTEPKPGVWVFNLGQNFSGWVRLKAKGEPGRKVVLKFAEMLNPDGTIYTANLRGAACTDNYVLKGGGEETWEPRFTFHGFQYVEITGYPGTPAMDDVTGIALSSDSTMSSSFECSNPMLNKLYQNIVWGQRSNYLEVPTDCPQRDERMGWTGDAQVFIGTGAYNQDVAAFFTSWLATLGDSQRPDGAYTDTSPGGGGGTAGWGDAGIVCPWTIWRMYGDTRIIERQYAGMARWIEYCEQHSSGLLRPAEGYGDWLSVGAETPKDVIGTAYFAHSTELLAEMAEAIGKVEDAAKYRALADSIKRAFNQAYVAQDGKIKGDTQTAYLMALGFDLLPEALRAAAGTRLVELIEASNWHLSTGFLGVNLLLPTLTGVNRTDVSYRLLQNESFPSWGYPVKHGATTIWERWDGWTEDQGFQNPGMNSFNHYAYGACGQWMFSTMAGIDTEDPGFKKLLIRPQPGGGISYVRAFYDSIHGRIVSNWNRDGEKFTMEVTIPANTTATVHVPARDAAGVTESGKPTGEVEGVKFLRMENNAAVYAVGSGTYRFQSTLPETTTESQPGGKQMKKEPTSRVAVPAAKRPSAPEGAAGADAAAGNAAFTARANELASDIFRRLHITNAPPITTDAIGTFYAAKEIYDAGRYDECRRILDAFWKRYPMESKAWQLIAWTDEAHILGHPHGHAALQMLTECCRARTSPDWYKEPPVPLQWTVVLMGKLVTKSGTTKLDERLVANDMRRVRRSMTLFLEYVKAMTKGRIEVQPRIVYLPDYAVPVYGADVNGERGLDSEKVAADLPKEVRDTTDWWWMIYPLRPTCLIGGGMGGANGGPCFLCEDGWVVGFDIAGHPDRVREDEEYDLYFSQWLQHEFYHFVFGLYPEFELEKEDHQWFDLAKWPADFAKGQFESDYYSEALHKRLQAQAAVPLHVKFKPKKVLQ